MEITFLYVEVRLRTITLLGPYIDGSFMQGYALFFSFNIYVIVRNTT